MLEGWLDWSFLKYAEGEISAAKDLLLEAMRFDPTCHQYHYRLVVYYYDLGYLQEAHKHLEFGLTLCFDDHFLIFYIEPKLKNQSELLTIIEAYRK
jgi:tetratricopeptide (TPR) repeat protein